MIRSGKTLTMRSGKAGQGVPVVWLNPEASHGFTLQQGEAFNA